MSKHYTIDIYPPNLKGETDEDGDHLIWTNTYGELHREDGYAFVNTSTGNKYWFNNGLLHREDGPAIIFNNDNPDRWYIIDKEISKIEWIQRLKDGKSSLDQKTITKLILKWS
jgi:hypothetical protein